MSDKSKEQATCSRMTPIAIQPTGRMTNKLQRKDRMTSRGSLNDKGWIITCLTARKRIKELTSEIPDVTDVKNTWRYRRPTNILSMPPSYFMYFRVITYILVAMQYNDLNRWAIFLKLAMTSLARALSLPTWFHQPTVSCTLPWHRHFI